MSDCLNWDRSGIAGLQSFHLSCQLETITLTMGLADSAVESVAVVADTKAVQAQDYTY